MKLSQKLLTWLFAFFTGLIIGSLWIGHDENYKKYLPIILFIVLIKFLIYDKAGKN